MCPTIASRGHSLRNETAIVNVYVISVYMMPHFSSIILTLMFNTVVTQAKKKKRCNETKFSYSAKVILGPVEV